MKKIINAWFDALDYWKANPEESLKIMAKAAETPVDEYKAGVDSVKIFQLEDNMKAFPKGDTLRIPSTLLRENSRILKRLGYADCNSESGKLLGWPFCRGSHEGT